MGALIVVFQEFVSARYVYAGKKNKGEFSRQNKNYFGFQWAFTVARLIGGYPLVCIGAVYLDAITIYLGSSLYLYD